MEQKPQPPQIPLVPLNAPTIGANIAMLLYAAGNGGFTLYLFDQREAPVMQLGESPRTANFEVARFTLTPRAVRGLEQSIAAALKAHVETEGAEVPTIPQFDARAQMGNLERLLEKPPPDDSAK